MDITTNIKLSSSLIHNFGTEEDLMQAENNDTLTRNYKLDTFKHCLEPRKYLPN